VAPTTEGGILISYLADTGVGVGAPVIATAPAYPVAIARSLVNLSTNLLEAVTLGGVVTFALLQNGVAVPGFTTSYATGESGIKTAVAGPVAYLPGDTFDLQVTADTLAVALDASATVGVI